MLKNDKQYFIIVTMMLCQIDTCFSFGIIKKVIVVWATDFKVKPLYNKLLLPLGIMSGTDTDFSWKRKKVFYKYNVMSFT